MNTPKQVMVAEEVKPAFAAIGGILTCPLCTQQYTDTPEGEEELREHLYQTHKVIV